MQLSSMPYSLDRRMQIQLPAQTIRLDHLLIKAIRKCIHAWYLFAVILYLSVGQTMAEEAHVPLPAPEAPLSVTPPAASAPAPMAAEAAGPKLEMRMPAPNTASGKRQRSGSKRDEDARACLEQATVAKIRACAEKFR